MKDPRKNKKRVKRYQDRCEQVSIANAAYRAVLKSVVGWSEFQNIDARANTDHVSLYQAARQWTDEVWND